MSQNLNEKHILKILDKDLSNSVPMREKLRGKYVFVKEIIKEEPQSLKSRGQQNERLTEYRKQICD